MAENESSTNKTRPHPFSSGSISYYRLLTLVLMLLWLAKLPPDKSMGHSPKGRYKCLVMKDAFLRMWWKSNFERLNLKASRHVSGRKAGDLNLQREAEEKRRSETKAGWVVWVGEGQSTCLNASGMRRNLDKFCSWTQRPEMWITTVLSWYSVMNMTMAANKRRKWREQRRENRKISDMIRKKTVWLKVAKTWDHYGGFKGQRAHRYMNIACRPIWRPYTTTPSTERL